MAQHERTDVVGEHVTRGDGGKEYPSAGILSVTNAPPVYKSVADLPAYFGDFGGRFIPETLMDAHKQLEEVRRPCGIPVALGRSTPTHARRPSTARAGLRDSERRP